VIAFLPAARHPGSNPCPSNLSSRDYWTTPHSRRSSFDNRRSVRALSSSGALVGRRGLYQIAHQTSRRSRSSNRAAFHFDPCGPTYSNVAKRQDGDLSPDQDRPSVRSGNFRPRWRRPGEASVCIQRGCRSISPGVHPGGCERGSWFLKQPARALKLPFSPR